jgi:galactose mutarotase-like enzyme
LITILKSDKLIAKINHKGAELISLKNDVEKEFIWNGNPEFWSKHSPILFPIVGTLKNNEYYFEGKKYSLNRHGFARDMDFELIAKNDSTAVFSLVNNTNTLNVYPFEFELLLNYELTDNSLIITFKIINKNLFSMPFSIGAHPAFALPEQFENYSLDFEYSEKLIRFELENDLLSNVTNSIPRNENNVALHYDLFEKDALVFKKIKSKKITLLENKKPFLCIQFDDFPSLGIWTKPKAPFICIEPWLGYADTTANSGNILEKEGIKIIEANEIFKLEYSITLL